MNSPLLLPCSILAAALVIAAAIYFRPPDVASRTQALYGNGYVYLVDLQKREVANMIPVKQ